MIVWIVAASLELLVLIRSFLGRTVSKYHFFYIYVACVLTADVSRFIVNQARPYAYQNWYWGSEFVCVILGYSVLMEILEKGLASFKGPRRLARNICLVVFGAIVAFTAVQGGFGLHWSSTLTSIEVETNLRIAELVFLGCILFLVFHYSIPVGTNLRGIILGYGLYIATAVMNSAVRTFEGNSGHAFFSLVGTYSYLLSLTIWTVTLWSLRPDPVVNRPGQLEIDYRSLVRRTRNALDAMRSFLGKAGRL